MLRNLSYLNLLFAVGYFLAYLQNGSPLVVAGLVTTVVFNWLVLRKLEREEWSGDLLWWMFACCNLCFGCYIGYGAAVLLFNVADYQYYPATVLWLSASGLLFAGSLIFHLFLSVRKITMKKDD